MSPVNSPASPPRVGGASPAGAGWRATLPFFYGWLLVAGCFLVLGIVYAIWYSFSVFYVALLHEFGWSRAASAGVFSVFVLVNGVGGAAAGALSDRFGPGRVAAAGGTLLGVSLLACSQLSELWQLYLLFGVLCAMGLSGTGWVPCVTMIGRWFSARLGAALGTASAGVGAGILVVVPLSQLLIQGLGWRGAYQVLAGLVLLGVVPVALLLLKGRPEDLGMARDGSRLDSPVRRSPPGVRQPRRPAVEQEGAEQDWTVATVVRTRRFWLILAMLFLTNVGAQMIFVHQVAFLVDGGYDGMVAASIVGLVGLISVGAKIGSGFISDRLGRELTWTIGLGCQAFAIVVLMATRVIVFPPLIYLFAVAFAVGYGASTPLAPAIVADIFAGRRFGAIYGTAGIASGLGSAVGAWLAGYVFDVSGSYHAAFLSAAVTSLAGAALVWIVAPSRARAERIHRGRVVGARG